MANKIGMMAHAFPTVFSFYLPEYVPDNRPGEASLVSPEAQIMDMPKTIGLLNGMFSLIKYGLSNCHAMEVLVATGSHAMKGTSLELMLSSPFPGHSQITHQSLKQIMPNQ